MRLTVGAANVALGSVVAELVARPLQIAEAKTRDGKQYHEIAIQQMTGLFAVQVWDMEVPKLESGEEYRFTVSLQNDGYGKAVQPRMSFIAAERVIRKPEAPQPK